MPDMASTERPNWAPESIDLDQPNVARVYDYLLGGAANFAPDREFAEKLLAMMPEARPAARLNRAFLRRAVQFCVEAGIRQFLDIGSGIPTVGNVHEIAQRIDPECRVVYVDTEPVAVTHAQLMLQDNDRAAALRADLLDVDTIMDSEPVRQLIDPDQPVALLLVSMLHFIPDKAGPYEAVARYVDRLARGSYLVISHGVMAEDAQTNKRVEDLYRERDYAAAVGRRIGEVERFFTGTELVEPGLVRAPEWHPESPDDVPANVLDRPEAALIAVGVGRKP
jgi:S-adenosyl methyltransferase